MFYRDFDCSLPLHPICNVTEYTVFQLDGVDGEYEADLHYFLNKV